MKKPVLGMLLGGVLGIFDGLTALVSAPETAPDIVGIVIGSTFKGLIVGLLVGWFAYRKQSMAAGILVGVVVSSFFAYLVAAMGGQYYLEIIVPGAIVGLIVGYATQRYGRGAAPEAASRRAAV